MNPAHQLAHLPAEFVARIHQRKGDIIQSTGVFQ
ncbi:Uncharacterised protein [Vibrio cholerae]|nr:Uncharacterised protein [Vibrio cholerae]